MKTIAIALLAFTLCGCASGIKKPATQYVRNSTSFDSDAGIFVRLPHEGSVPFRGEINFDNSGGNPGGMMYPAPNAAGFLAAVLTHAAIAGSVANSQETALQNKANGVLQPYNQIIASFSYGELGKMIEKRWIEQPAKRPLRLQNDTGTLSGYILESNPLFVVNQDKTGITLQNIVAIYPTGHPETVLYKNLIIVVSDSSSDKAQHWIDNDGDVLKQESSALLARSTQIVVDDLARPLATDVKTYQTFHYKAGTSDRYERGELLDESEGRRTIRNLRGWLMSLPNADAQAISMQSNM